MHMEAPKRPSVDPMLVRTLARAVDGSGKLRRSIVRETGLHKDARLGAIRGIRAVITGEAVRLLAAPLDAYGYRAILGRDPQALPAILAEALRENLQEIRPRWAIGTSRLVAMLLAEHVRDVINRDLSMR